MTVQELTAVNPQLLLPNPFQPRKVFNDQSIKELADSIQENGLLQPPVVAYDGEKDDYFIIAGERRIRAVIELGWDSVPVLIQEMPTDKDFQVMGLLENLQREDLSPIDIAEGYQTLVTRYGLTQEALSKRMGWARSTVANTLRLTGCTEKCKSALREGKIQEGHALAILSAEDPEIQDKVLDEAIFAGLNVRQTLLFANRMSGKTNEGSGPNPLIENPYTSQLQRYTKEAKFIPSPHGGGRINLAFETDEELDTFMSNLIKED